jgi:hypothetical protein
MEEDNKSKRPRDIVSDTEGLEPLTKTKHPPSYGSQEYWEHRYNKNFKDGTDAKTKKGWFSGKTRFRPDLILNIISLCHFRKFRGIRGDP